MGEENTLNTINWNLIALGMKLNEKHDKILKMIPKRGLKRATKSFNEAKMGIKMGWKYLNMPTDRRKFLNKTILA